MNFLFFFFFIFFYFFFFFVFVVFFFFFFFFFSSRRRHTRWNCDWSSDVCSSDLTRLNGWEDSRAGSCAGKTSGCAPRSWRCRMRACHTRFAPSWATSASARSEERRVGKEWRSGWWGDDGKRKMEGRAERWRRQEG